MWSTERVRTVAEPNFITVRKEANRLETLSGLASDPWSGYEAGVERAIAENRLSEATALYPQAEKLVEAFSENPRRKQK